MTCRILIILLFVSSCAAKQRVPDNVINPEKMGNVLRDMIKADAFAQEISQRDSSKVLRTVNIQLYNNIFELYSITEDQFQKSYAYYERNPSIMYNMFDSLGERQ